MLNSNGLLAPGRHKITVADVGRIFVDPFPKSKTRATLLQKWIDHREAISALVPIQAQWVDGSYATSKIDPGDVDVVTFIDGPTLDGLSLGQKLLVQSLVSGHQTRDTWSIDSFVIPVYPAAHPQHLVTLMTMKEWTRLFGRGRDGVAKGFLEVSG